MNIFFITFAKTCFYFMSKGLDILMQVDSEVRDRLQVVPDNTTIEIAILESKQNLKLQKMGDKLLTCKDKNKVCDLKITFKFFKTLPNIVFGTSSINEAYLNEEFFVKGELRYAVAVIFALEKFMAYLLPQKTYTKKYERKPNNATRKTKFFFKLMFSKRGRV